MQRWSVSIRANWSQFPAFIMATSGHVLRPYAAVCCHSLALPSPRPATGIKRSGCAVVDRVGKNRKGIGKKMIATDTKNELGITVAKDLRAVMQGKVAIAGEASYEA